MSDPYKVEAYGGPSGWGDGWNVTGPNVAGGWDGTVPKSHDGMEKQDAEWLADLMNRAFKAGRDHARMTMRMAMGIED